MCYKIFYYILVSTLYIYIMYNNLIFLENIHEKYKNKNVETHFF